MRSVQCSKAQYADENILYLATRHLAHEQQLQQPERQAQRHVNTYMEKLGMAILRRWFRSSTWQEKAISVREFVFFNLLGICSETNSLVETTGGSSSTPRKGCKCFAVFSFSSFAGEAPWFFGTVPDVCHCCWASRPVTFSRKELDAGQEFSFDAAAATAVTLKTPAATPLSTKTPPTAAPLLLSLTAFIEIPPAGAVAFLHTTFANTGDSIAPIRREGHTINAMASITAPFLLSFFLVLSVSSKLFREKNLKFFALRQISKPNS